VYKHQGSKRNTLGPLLSNMLPVPDMCDAEVVVTLDLIAEPELALYTYIKTTSYKNHSTDRHLQTIYERINCASVKNENRPINATKNHTIVWNCSVFPKKCAGSVHNSINSRDHVTRAAYCQVALQLFYQQTL